MTIIHRLLRAEGDNDPETVGEYASVRSALRARAAQQSVAPPGVVYRVLSLEATAPPPRRRGLAAISPERRRVIASLGGRAAHALGKANEWTPEEARIAGRKGGRTPRRRPVESR